MTRIAVIFICVVYFTALSSAIGQRTTLTSGDEVEVFYLRSGLEHEFDLRTFQEKIREKLPTAVQKYIPAEQRQDWSALGAVGGADSLGIGIKYHKPSHASPDLADEVLYILSDNTGWYYNGLYGNIRLDDATGMAFHVVPRTSRSLTLSLYQMGSDRVPGIFLGRLNFPNPHFDAKLLAATPIAFPGNASDRNISIQIDGMWTGIAIRDVPQLLYDKFRSGATHSLTPDVNALIAGNPKAAKFPELTRTVLLFRPQSDGKVDTARIRTASIKFTDSKGAIREVLSRLFIGDDGCVLMWDNNLPLNDGNYDFALTIYEDPLTSSSSWVTMPALVPGASDISSTKTVSLGTSLIRAGMTQSRQRIDLTATVDPSLLAMRAIQTETSRPLQLSFLHGGQVRNPFWCYAEFVEPVTTGSVTLRFAKTIEHKISFTGTPKRPAAP